MPALFQLSQRALSPDYARRPSSYARLSTHRRHPSALLPSRSAYQSGRPGWVEGWALRVGAYASHVPVPRAALRSVRWEGIVAGTRNIGLEQDLQTGLNSKCGTFRVCRNQRMIKNMAAGVGVPTTSHPWSPNRGNVSDTCAPPVCNNDRQCFHPRATRGVERRSAFQRLSITSP